MGHAGFVSVPSESGDRVNNLYTWIQPCSDCDETSPDTPMIVWLQGGPGAPGNFGSFAEIGNYYVDGDLNLQERCFTWCATANCLFIDQPTMTGFSFQSYPNGTAISDPKAVEYTTTSPKAMEQVYQVLVQMFTIFPEHQKQPLYITGESYGGIYTGNLGWVIYNHNQQLQAQHLSEKFSKTAALRGPNPVPTTMPINFVGLAVGDPVMNGQYQWGTYANTLYGMGVVMLDEREELTTIFDNGIDALKKFEAGTGDCWTAFEFWNSVWQDDSGGGLPGKFANFTGSDNSENVLLGAQPAEFDYWSDFMVKHKAEMHCDGSPSTSTWEGGEVYHTMVRSGDFCRNSSWIYASLYEKANIDLMIYSSTADALLGPPTTEGGVMAVLDYSEANFGSDFKKDYLAAPKEIWRTAVNDTNLAGYARCTVNDKNKRFCYTVIRNGGHETPAFQPRTS
eukprot:INCI13045.2.p2 GENE.INCI13045.2~~INCI13045.2.p2  ORF type:complete len:526 (-),score=95.10 INCI13045.2:1887-3239(-)